MHVELGACQTEFCDSLTNMVMLIMIGEVGQIDVVIMVLVAEEREVRCVYYY